MSKSKTIVHVVAGSARGHKVYVTGPRDAAGRFGAALPAYPVRDNLDRPQLLDCLQDLYAAGVHNNRTPAEFLRRLGV